MARAHDVNPRRRVDKDTFHFGIPHESLDWAETEQLVHQALLGSGSIREQWLIQRRRSALESRYLVVDHGADSCRGAFTSTVDLLLEQYAECVARDAPELDLARVRNHRVAPARFGTTRRHQA